MQLTGCITHQTEHSEQSQQTGRSPVNNLINTTSSNFLLLTFCILIQQASLAERIELTIKITILKTQQGKQVLIYREQNSLWVWLSCSVHPGEVQQLLHMLICISCPVTQQWIWMLTQNWAHLMPQGDQISPQRHSLRYKVDLQMKRLFQTLNHSCWLTWILKFSIVPFL